MFNFNCNMCFYLFFLVSFIILGEFVFFKLSFDLFFHYFTCLHPQLQSYFNFYCNSLLWVNTCFFFINLIYIFLNYFTHLHPQLQFATTEAPDKITRAVKDAEKALGEGEHLLGESVTLQKQVRYTHTHTHTHTHIHTHTYGYIHTLLLQSAP